MDSVNNCNVIRPLLSISRFETGKLCSFWQLPIYPDRSNQKVKFLRNRVRKQLVPIVKFFFNSKVEDVLLQFAEIVEFENQHMNQVAKGLFTSFNKLGCDNFTTVKLTQQNRWVSSFIKHTPLITCLPSLDYQLPSSITFEKNAARWSVNKSLHLFSESESDLIPSDSITTSTTAALQPTQVCTDGRARLLPKVSPALHLHTKGSEPQFRSITFDIASTPLCFFPRMLCNTFGATPLRACYLRYAGGVVYGNRDAPPIRKPLSITFGTASPFGLQSIRGKKQSGGLFTDQRLGIKGGLWYVLRMLLTSFSRPTFTREDRKRSKVNKLKSHPLGQINMIPFFLEEHHVYQRIINKVCESPMLRQKFCSVYKENQFCYLSIANLSSTIINSVDKTINPFSLVMKYKMYSDKTYKKQPSSATQLRDPEKHSTSALYLYTEGRKPQLCKSPFTLNLRYVSKPPLCFATRREEARKVVSGRVRHLRYADVLCANARDVSFAKLVTVDESLTNWFVAKHIIAKKTFLFNPLTKNYNFSLSFLKSIRFTVPFQSNELLRKRRLRDSILPASFFSWWIPSSYTIFSSNGRNTPFGRALCSNASITTSMLRNTSPLHTSLHTEGSKPQRGLQSRGVSPFQACYLRYAGGACIADVGRDLESGVPNVVCNQKILEKNGILEFETPINLINPNLWPLHVSTVKSIQKSLVTYALLTKPKVMYQFFMFSRFSLPIKRINKINKIKTSFWIWNKRVHSTKILNNVSKNFPKLFSNFAKEGIECVLLSRSIKNVLPFAKTFSWTNKWNVPLAGYIPNCISALPHNINATYILNNIFLNNRAKQDPTLPSLCKQVFHITSASQATLPTYPTACKTVLVSGTSPLRYTTKGGKKQSGVVQQTPHSASKGGTAGLSGLSRSRLAKLALLDSTRQSINKVAKEKYIEDIEIEDVLIYNFFLYFDKLKIEKKETYWPIFISFLPIAFQRRVSKLFLINQDWKKIRYLQVENFLIKQKISVK